MHRYALSSHDVGLHSSSSVTHNHSHSHGHTHSHAHTPNHSNNNNSSSSNSSNSSSSSSTSTSTNRNGSHKAVASKSKGSAGASSLATSGAGSFLNYPASQAHALPHYALHPQETYAETFGAAATAPIVASEYTSSYTSHYPLYGADWSTTKDQRHAKIALSSYREDSTNKLEILYGSPQYIDDDNNASDIVSSSDVVANSWSLTKRHDYTVKYPITRLQWDPALSIINTDVERLATTSECLRIYEVLKQDECDFHGTNSNYINNNNSFTNLNTATTAAGKLVEKTALTNSKSKNLNQLPPMTSFDWNRFDPNNLITCSIDTTCTVWNLTKETFVAKTQLIAHDSEVYDVKYIYGDTNVFASCSSDGSVRLFDLRNLDQSTIIYERSDGITSKKYDAQSSTPSAVAVTAAPAGPTNAKLNSADTGKLVRLATSNYNANQIAVLEAKSNRILVLDLRSVGLPLYTLHSHSAPVNSIAWHPKKNMLLSGGDDSQVLVHDFSSSADLDEIAVPHGKDPLPAYSFSSPMEVNSVCWNPTGEWVGINSGKQFQACQL